MDADDRAAARSAGRASLPVKRFLGNVHTLEVHDRYRERPGCRLSEIAPGHGRGYDTLRDALADRSYGNCYWCLGGELRGTSSR